MSARRPRARLATVIIRKPSRSKRGSEISTEAKDTGGTRAAYTARGRSADTRPTFGRVAAPPPRDHGRNFGTPLANVACYREEAAMAGDDITIEILKEIRAELRGVNQRFDGMDKRFDGMDKRFDGMDKRFDGMDQRFDTLEERIDLTSQRLDITNERLGVVESTLLTLARRQRTTIKYLKATAEHGSGLDTRVTDLEARVGRLENR